MYKGFNSAGYKNFFTINKYHGAYSTWGLDLALLVKYSQLYKPKFLQPIVRVTSKRVTVRLLNLRTRLSEFPYLRELGLTDKPEELLSNTPDEYLPCIKEGVDFFQWAFAYYDKVLIDGGLWNFGRNKENQICWFDPITFRESPSKEDCDVILEKI